MSNIRIVYGTAVYTGTSYSVPTTPLQPIANTRLLLSQSPRFVDNSATNNTVTLSGSPTIQRFSPFSGTTLPTPYYGAYFDGTGDYLSFPSNAAFAMGTGDFTVEGYVYLTTTQSYGTLFLSSTTGTGSSLHIQINNANKVRVTDASSEYLLATSAITTNTWTHIAVVRSGTTLTIYQNGTSNGTTTNSTNFTQSGALIGLEPVGGTYYYTGYFSNIRVVKGNAVYTGAFTVPTSPLSATQSSGTNISAITGTETSLLTCQSATFIDNSTNNFTITAYGNSQPTYYNPFTVSYSSLQAYSSSVNGGSMYFDGTTDYVYATVTAPGTNDYTLEAWVYFTAAPKGVIQITNS